MELLSQKVAPLTDSPLRYGVFLGFTEALPERSASAPRLALVGVEGRRYLASFAADIHSDTLTQGREVWVSQTMTIVGVGEFFSGGSAAEVIRTLKSEGARPRILVRQQGRDDFIVEISDQLSAQGVEIGDLVRIDARLEFAFDLIPELPCSALTLKPTPDVSFADIGGLEKAIDQIREAVELPYLHPSLFETYQLSRPHGILLYGPPGCGKTLLAKATAHSLISVIHTHNASPQGIPRGPQSDSGAQEIFLHIKGPDLLHQNANETRRLIDKVFAKVRRKAGFLTPLVIFLDDMEFLFGAGADGQFSILEKALTSQLLIEVDQAAALEHVILIGAVDRPEMIDPAIMKSGRFDVKIRIDRPDQRTAQAILALQFAPDLPLLLNQSLPIAEKTPVGCSKSVTQETALRKQLLDDMINRMADILFNPDSHLAVVTTEGKRLIYALAEFVSGARLVRIANRAKTKAIKRQIASNIPSGIQAEDLISSIREEFLENAEQLAMTRLEQEFGVTWIRTGRIRMVEIHFKNLIIELPLAMNIGLVKKL